MSPQQVFKKVTLYQLADGRTVNTLEEARSEGLKADTLKKMTDLIESKGVLITPEQKSLIRGTINAMIDIGWRPPAKKYSYPKKNSVAK
jgi:hypothetical protein